MKNNKRSAFTIVELVIVIAVIAILSAVLIPTFGAIIKDANVAADQTAASTLTSELHIHLKGNPIDSEEELMTALEESGVGEKLVPKALTYGYHFWFDMENQMFVAKTAEEIQADRAPYEGSAATGIRNVFNNGYFLSDSPETLSNMFGDMSAITKDTYDDYIRDLNTAAEFDDNYGLIATEVLKTFKKTVIFNDNGVFYYADAKNSNDSVVYFASGVKVISPTHYVYNGTGVDTIENGTLPTPVSEINLPSSVVLVEAGALNFATANSVEIKTNFNSYERLASILSPDCSNALFLDAAGNKYVVSEREENGETIGTLHQYNGEGNTEYKCDLIKRIPFAEYELKANEVPGLVEWHDGKLYVAVSQMNKVNFFVKDKNSIETSTAVNDWDCGDNTSDIKVVAGTLTFDANGASTATIEMETYNLEGTKIPLTVDVVIVRPTSANIKVDGLDYALGTDKQITLDYNSASTTYDVVLSGNVFYDSPYSLGSNNIKVTSGNDSVVRVDANNNITFDLTKSDNTFTVTVDGCLETTFTVNLNNNELAVFKTNFHHEKQEKRPYYVGTSNEIALSSLVSLKDGKSFNTATVTIYDRTEGKTLYYVNEINNTPNGISADYTKTPISKNDWNNETIKLNLNTDHDSYIEGSTIYVEIATDNGVSTYITLKIADGAVNVVGSEFANLSNIDTDIVLHGDATNITNNTKIDLGSNTLFGNGYKIVAKTYKSLGTGNNYLNDYLISVNGGTIDNVYLDGPVYPWFDFDTATNGTHVSGVKAEGNSTIQHSYLSGFRQPAACYGGTLTIDNTTLRGGNLANLLLAEGNINIHNVTTVQDQDGQENTFGEKKNNALIRTTGFGVFIDRTAVDETGESPKITITGYFDQYNWIEKNQGADLPTVNGIDMDQLWEMLFHVNVTLEVKSMFTGRVYASKTVDKSINFINHYIHEVGGKQYVNAGIVFAAIGNSSDKNGVTGINTIYSNLNNVTITDNRSLTKEQDSYINPRTLGSTRLEQFSTYAIEEVYGITVYASSILNIIDKMEKVNGQNIISINVLEAASVLNANQNDVAMQIWSYNQGVTMGSEGYPLEWTQGYYINYGN